MSPDGFDLEIIAETTNGLHILYAKVQNQAHGEMVGEALYRHYNFTERGQIRYVWLIDKTFPQPHLLNIWPKDTIEQQNGSLAAWKAAPHSISGADES